MKDICYDFIDFDSIESFGLLGKSLGGVLQNKTLHFDNNIAKGEIILSIPEEGLWIRKWKLTTFQKVILQKKQAPPENEKKLVLVYFLNPSIFSLKNNSKKVKIGSSQNNILLTSDIAMDFSVIPKQPFYVLDIAFTTSWLYKHFNDADSSFKTILNQLLNESKQPILVEPSSIEEYKTLHELESSVQADNEDILFVRSRVYYLIVNFFSKIINRNWSEVIQNTVRYEQIMRVASLVMENVKELPSIDTIAKEVNMSASSLLRQFKLIYKKSIHEYYVERKMELAKRMILENGISIKEMAAYLGYKQASPFIESFTKHHGYSPGRLRFKSV